jgi:hypothetical protein
MADAASINTKTDNQTYVRLINLVAFFMGGSFLSLSAYRICDAMVFVMRPETGFRCDQRR